MTSNYDLIIIGGGPAGTAGAVYSARKQLKTLMITPEYGGQSIVSPDIQNWIGTPSISGADLAKSFESHINANKGEYLEVLNETVTAINKVDKIFEVTTSSNNKYNCKAILICSGSGRKKLECPGADIFEHKGLTYCASCDGPLFSGQDVAVVGSGNAGFETALQLLAYCKSVTMISRGNDFKADPVTVASAQKHDNFKIITNAEIVEIYGDNFVKGLKFRLINENQDLDLPVTGIFVEIGQKPNTEFVKEIVTLDNFGKIIVDPKTQMSQTPGIWSAGDASDGLYHQNNIAAGDAVKAVENIYIWIKNNQK